MCGRFTLRTPHTRLLDQFKVDRFKPRFNVAPTQLVLTVREDGKQRELVSLQFGMTGPQGQVINARSETVASRPMFRDSYRQRRCLVPADGFYEWQRVGRKKLPYYIQLKDESPFAFAGIWRDDQFVLLTTAANELLATLHDRMPVIIDPADYDRWLDPATPPEKLEELLQAWPADKMQMRPVSPYVNSPTHDDPACIEPRPEERMLF